MGVDETYRGSLDGELDLKDRRHRPRRIRVRPLIFNIASGGDELETRAG